MAVEAVGTPTGTLTGTRQVHSSAIIIPEDANAVDVSVYFGDADATVASVTIGEVNGIPVTREGSPGGTTHATEKWVVVNPPTGSQTLTVNLSASVESAMAGQALRGVDTTDPIRDFEVASGANGAGSPIGATVTTEAGDLVTDALSMNGTTLPTRDAAQTPFRETNNSDVACSSYKAGAAGSTSMLWTNTSGAQVAWSYIAVAYRAAGGGGTTVIGRSVASAWHVRSAIAREARTEWNSRSIAGRSAGTTWNTRAAVEASAGFAWDTRATAGRTASSEWNVGASTAIIGRSANATWNLHALAGSSANCEWDVAASIGRSAEIEWHLHAITSRAAPVVWHTRSVVSRDAPATWHVRTIVGWSAAVTAHLRELAGVDAVAEWNVQSALTSVGRSSASTWNARAAAGRSAASAWYSASNIGRDAGVRWTTRTLRGRSTASTWSTRQAVGYEAAVRWSTRATAGRSMPTSWMVVGVDSEPVIPIGISVEYVGPAIELDIAAIGPAFSIDFHIYTVEHLTMATKHVLRAGATNVIRFTARDLSYLSNLQRIAGLTLTGRLLQDSAPVPNVPSPFTIPEVAAEIYEYAITRQAGLVPGTAVIQLSLRLEDGEGADLDINVPVEAWSV